MKILLHGAINGANFGDCIFADMFYKRLKELFPNASVDFYEGPIFGIGNYLQEKLKYTTHKKQNLNEYDALVYISGGYFGEDTKSIKASIIRVIRYFILGLRMIRLQKKIYVIGVEVGPLHYRLVRSIAKKILAYADLLIVRNIASQDYCKKLGIATSKLSYDTAFLLKTNKHMLPGSKYKKINGRKMLFLHLIPGDNVNKVFYNKMLNPIVGFISSHREYDVVLSVDQASNDKFDEFVKFFEAKEIKCTIYEYNDYWELCNLISISDFILTRKLHVGIVGCAFSKSVIATPIHEYKTQRLYSYIGESNRCIPYKDVTGRQMSILLEKYYDTPISIDNIVSSKALDNINLMCKHIKKDFCDEQY